MAFDLRFRCHAKGSSLFFALDDASDDQLAAGRLNNRAREELVDTRIFPLWRSHQSETRQQW